MKKVAIIGSFQRSDNYAVVQSLVSLLRDNGFRVTSPDGSSVVDKRDGFVVFSSDDSRLTNQKIQYDTLEKIFSADAVYVVNVGGYIGRTTCYEIGRVLERRQPLYFYSRPNDLPICLTEEFIITPNMFIDIVSQSREVPLWLKCNSCKNMPICIGKANE